MTERKKIIVQRRTSKHYTEDWATRIPMNTRRASSLSSISGILNANLVKIPVPILSYMTLSINETTICAPI